MEIDWDLQALVRSCTIASSSSSSSTIFTTTNSGETPAKSEFSPQSWSSSLDNNKQAEVGRSLSLSDPFEARINANTDGLHELFRPFFTRSQTYFPPQGAPISSLCSLSVSKEHTCPKQPTQKSPTPRPKRRKNQVTKTCHVTAEALSSDVWAWRKYGQKPIKGTPYPRGYYRCSSAKGCPARKQVERHRSEPTMFKITFTDEHNHSAPTHRNSLVGTPQKISFTPPSVNASNSDDKTSPLIPKPTCSSAATSLENELSLYSTNIESREDEEQVDDFGGFSSMDVRDDFFEGLEEFALPTISSDCFSDHFNGSFGLPLFPNNFAPTAGAVLTLPGYGISDTGDCY